jgi:hypothetical protein
MLKQDKIDALVALRNSTQVSSARGTLWGLCGEIERLLFKRHISLEQKTFLSNILKSDTGAHGWDYVWPSRKLLPRIKWIDKQIKLLENENAG